MSEEALDFGEGGAGVDEEGGAGVDEEGGAGVDEEGGVGVAHGVGQRHHRRGDRAVLGLVQRVPARSASHEDLSTEVKASEAHVLNHWPVLYALQRATR
jgi:hypothetical protein